MANSPDVDSRLAEGQPAVDDVGQYVAACHRLGYQHPDLTAHAAQVQDWYAREDGLDLRALDGDCAVLSAVAAAAEDAARTQQHLLAGLAGAWSGRGAAAARDFVLRSGQAANAVSAAVRAAADASADLRDALWRAVDAKVAAVTAIDGRHQAQRAEWLAAATSVSSGTGDLAAASEMVDQQVRPFVDGDIGTDWVVAMRTADASITGAFDAARSAMAASPRAIFDVPGELGPRFEAIGKTPVGDAHEPLPPVATVPAAAALTTSGSPAAPWPSEAGPAPWPSAPLPSAPLPSAQGVTAPAAAPPLADLATQAPAASIPAAAATPGLGGLGGGTSSLGGGLSGFGQQLADLIGGLVGSADGGLPDATDVGELDDVGDPDEPPFDGDEDPAEDDDGDSDEDEDENSDEDEDEDEDDPRTAAVEAPTDAAPVDQEAVEPAAEPAPCAGESGPAPTPVPTVVAPQPESPPAPQAIPEAADETHEPTPCEIAADQLPQVGE